VHTQFTQEFALNHSSVIQNKQNNGITLEHFVPQLLRLSDPHIPKTLSTKPVKTDNNEKYGNLTEDKRTLDADVGILVHFYLQLIAENGVKNWPAERVKPLNVVMQRWFKQQAYDDVKAAQGATRVSTLLQTALNSEQGQWVLQDRDSAANELEIETCADQAVDKKIIDRTFIENGIRWIVDYKSTVLSDDDSEGSLKTTAEQYSAQLEGYEQLFIEEDLPIKKAIFFVSIGKLINI
jgi:ATP-dependent exoDNAse (exonuclease V) beta subunit